MCIPAPPAGPWRTAVNPIPAKSCAAAGVPDFVLCWRGRLVGIEIKVDGGRLSPAQREAHDAITLAGGVVTTCRTLDEVMDLLTTLGVPCRARTPHSAVSGREAA